MKNKLVDDFINILKDYKEGDYLYYEYFKTQIGISDEEFILIVNVLNRMGIVDKIYKIFCPACGEISRTLYHDISEIREINTCEKCDADLIETNELCKYILIYFKLVSHG